MMRLSRYGGSPNVGVFAATNESLTFVASDASPEFIKTIEETLGTEAVPVTVSGSMVIGSLIAMNSRGAIVPNFTDDSEFEKISSYIPCIRLDQTLNAAGNNILVNDTGAVVNPEFSDETIGIIEEFLGVRCCRSTVSGCDTVGSFCVATNKGCVCHPDTTEEEMNLISSVLSVEAARASVNHGSFAVGAGIIANSRGAVVGDTSTPIELGKIEDGLNLF